jgi:MoaA/NifB/PqqE/SkfB family radical SAM enzyme
MHYHLKSGVANLLGRFGYAVAKTSTIARLEADSQKAKVLASDIENIRLELSELRRLEKIKSDDTAAAEKNNRKSNELKARRVARSALWIILEKAVSADHYFYLDIIGHCNLECPSCPVGNYTPQAKKGVMSIEKYSSILEKIINEHSDQRVFIDLYNWAEPILHKSLPDIVRMTRERNIGVGISTNLNAFPNMRDVIRSHPTYIRISLSGYNNETYKTTHRGGDVNVVKSNMHLLRHHMDAVGIQIPVQVGFHIYKTNFPDDFLEIERLSDELGFYFMPSIATFMPIEKAILAMDGIVPSADAEIHSKLVLSMEERSRILQSVRAKNVECDFQKRRTSINYDGSVSLCCATYDQAQLISKDFLKTSRERLHKLKHTNEFCSICANKNLDMIMTGAGYGLIEEAAKLVLGKTYSDYLDQTRMS